MRITATPVELQEHMLSYLAWDDHIRCLQVCSLWRSLLTSSPLLKSGRYAPCAAPTPYSSIHSIFTTPGVSCLFNGNKSGGRSPDSGFRLALPSKSSDPCAVEIDRSHTLVEPECPILDEPLFMPPRPGVEVPVNLFDLYIWGISICGEGLFGVPWEHVNGVVVENGYVRLSVRKFLEWIGGLLELDAGFFVKGGDVGAQRVEFMCSGEAPWLVGVRVV
ncbi:hypothetical protein DRE_00127 [Drechslerella stenobrocha 248]|uniref:F-box domain-containing protein n=1 Tax=Drechslerella stenobrocha 248 TaxID=1043628 RepID=W7I9Q3_9PEZI|nr:hypothetical protein DRE_00127 [Drechslerella stenobrocha 248]